MSPGLFDTMTMTMTMLRATRMSMVDVVHVCLDRCDDEDLLILSITAPTIPEGEVSRRWSKGGNWDSSLGIQRIMGGGI